MIFMDAVLKNELLSKHIEANTKLYSAAGKWTGNGSTKVYKEIGKMVGCSGITIGNYVNGDGKDGFLTQVITKAFKKYKP